MVVTTEYRTITPEEVSKVNEDSTHSNHRKSVIWTVPGFEDTKLVLLFGAVMEPGAGQAKTEVYARVQACACQDDRVELVRHRIVRSSRLCMGARFAILGKWGRSPF